MEENKEEKKNLKPSYLRELSDVKVDNLNNEDFLIDICRLMKNNDEYQDLTKKPNFGFEEISEQRQEVIDVGDIFTLKNFIRDNIKKVRLDKKLQKEIKVRIERLKPTIVKKDGVVDAELRMFESLIDDMLNEGVGDN